MIKSGWVGDAWRDIVISAIASTTFNAIETINDFDNFGECTAYCLSNSRDAQIEIVFGSRASTGVGDSRVSSCQIKAASSTAFVNGPA